MRVLELFSGTGSIGRVCRRQGHDVTSLDMILPADIKEDIMTWDYTIYPPQHFDLITSSPVCTYWSVMQNSFIGRGKTRASIQADIDRYGKPMVDKVREILAHFQPRWFWIENPQTGRMKEYITDLPYHDVHYCQYGFDYRKATRIWTNIQFQPKVCNRSTCPSIVEVVDDDGKVHHVHKKNLGNNAVKRTTPTHTTKHERYRIPEPLIEDLLAGCR